MKMECYTKPRWNGGKKKHRPSISEFDVRAAVREFVKKGGLIKKMPDEVIIPPGFMVGWKYGLYEIMSQMEIE